MDPCLQISNKAQEEWREKAMKIFTKDVREIMKDSVVVDRDLLITVKKYLLLQQELIMLIEDRYEEVEYIEEPDEEMLEARKNLNKRLDNKISNINKELGSLYIDMVPFWALFRSEAPVSEVNLKK